MFMSAMFYFEIHKGNYNGVDFKYILWNSALHTSEWQSRNRFFLVIPHS